MPHSGGGGSHSGGGHSGGSHGGSHSSGRSQPRISNTYFKGSKHYVYYYNHKPHYYYAVRPYDPHEGSVVPIIMGLSIMVMAIISAIAFFTIAQGRLPLDYDTKIVIDDGAGVIDQTEELEQYLLNFQEKSGVTVSVVTRTTSSAYMGDDCERQAYNCYVSRWDDESHWLIYYVGNKADRSDNWEWNLMCGDDCLKVLPQSQEDAFSEKFHRYLVASERYSFEDCVVKALDSLKIYTDFHIVYRNGVKVNGSDASGKVAGAGAFAGIGVFLAAGLVFFVIGIRSAVKKPSEEQKAKHNAIRLSEGKVTEDNCEYCGGVYVVGTVNKCPHCNAPIRAHSNI